MKVRFSSLLGRQNRVPRIYRNHQFQQEKSRSLQGLLESPTELTEAVTHFVRDN